MGSEVVAADGRVLFDHEHIQAGQGGGQSIGGQESGASWGHGAYVAPTGFIRDRRGLVSAPSEVMKLCGRELRLRLDSCQTHNQRVKVSLLN